MHPIITENMDKAIYELPPLFFISLKNRTIYIDTNFSLHFDHLNNIIYFSLCKIKILFLPNLSVYMCEFPY